MGFTTKTNPYFKTRQRFQKLYVDFRVPRVWWRLVLLGRKLLLVFTSIMFRLHPMFQAALSVAVMFMAYVLQAKHKPFLQKGSIPMHYMKLIQAGERDKVPKDVLQAFDDNPK